MQGKHGHPVSINSGSLRAEGGEGCVCGSRDKSSPPCVNVLLSLRLKNSLVVSTNIVIGLGSYISQVIIYYIHYTLWGASPASAHCILNNDDLARPISEVEFKDKD